MIDNANINQSNRIIIDKKSISPLPQEMYYSVYSAVEEVVAAVAHLAALAGLALA